MCLDVSANTRGLGVLALREAGREVSEAGLLRAAAEGDASLCASYLDAGVPIDCVDRDGKTPLHLSCECDSEHLEIATLLLDRGSTAIDEKGEQKTYPHLLVVLAGNASWRLARGVPEQLEQVRVAQVTHPAASSSAHEVPDNRHGARRAAGPCEVEWRRAWSSSATSPSRLGQSVLSVLHPRQFEGRCFAVRHPDPKCAHASAAPAASCARVSITHVVACLRPPACVAVGRGTPKHLHSTAIDEKDRDGRTAPATPDSCIL